MKAFIYCLLALLISLSSMGQTDPILFSVDNQPVHRSEFEYIYKKNNADKADFSKESVQEYLDLYVKFKLKVAKAKQLKLDTIVSLQKELEGYRNQLAKAYMVDKDVTDNLIDEAIERIKKDIKVSHVLLSLDKFATQEQVDEAYSKINRLRKKISKFDDFKLMAKTISDDKSSGSRDGNLGWMTALLPDGFYEFENAIYALKPGEISEPVRSKLGVHLLAVTDTRPARGEMEVSHILVRARMKGQEVVGAKAKADSLYQLLVDGTTFKKVAADFSDDKNTNLKGGYLGFFGISQLDKNFENAAFALEQDGDFSKPIRTAIGWHIILRKSKKNYDDPDKLKRSLKEKITQNDRYELAKKARLVHIRKEGEFKEFKPPFDAFVKTLNKDFFTYKWETPKLNDQLMFKFNDGQQFGSSAFEEYCKNNVRTRLRMDKSMQLEKAAQQLYQEFVDQKTISYEEANLEKKYPAFKALMNEYSEGILLFEATKINVWDKATADSTALRKYYESNSKEYVWKPRAKVAEYEVKNTAEKVIGQFSKDLKKMDAAKLVDRYSKLGVDVLHKDGLYEVGSRPLLGLKWAEGDIYGEKDEKTGYTIIKKIEQILPASPKTFKECRGYVIADYQEEIEKEWVASLAKEFNVQINQDVLKDMIQ